jgi:hypothetical protein
MSAVTMPRSLAATLVIALPLAGLLWLSGAVPALAALAAMIVFVLVVVSAGLALLRAAGASDMPAAAAWVMGVLATAIAMYLLVIGLGLLASTAFAVWALLVLGLRVLLRPGAARGADAGELLGLLLCGLATAYWCRELAEVPRILARDGWLMTWTDQFIHGSAISQFGDPRAAGHHSIELAGLPLPAYHYASYMLPAAFARPLDLPGLALATSVWVPLGFLTACAGAYALGGELAGRGGAIASLAVLTLLPDAASYGLHNRLFGYYWYVIAVPGASYGVGIALLAIVFLRRWLRQRDLRPLIAGACVAAGVVLVRVHVFLVAFPAWLACAGLAVPLVRRRKLAFLGLVAGALALFVWGFYAAWPDAVHALEPFLAVTHNEQQPVAYRGLYHGLTVLYGPQVAIPAGIVLVFVAFLGGFVFLYPLSIVLARRSRGLEAIDLVPPALLVVYFLLMVTAPVPAHGDSTEFTQRPFVLVYAVVAVWSAASFAGWLAQLGGLRVRRVWLPLLLAGALTVMWALRYTVKDWRWAYAYQVAEGLPQAAALLRESWRPGDVLAAQGLKPGLVTTDPAVQLVSLTGVPAYVTRPFIHVASGGLRKEAALRRYAELEEVARAESAPAALARLRELGIAWYLVTSPERRGPRWDPQRRQAFFVDGMVALYRTRPVAR